MMLQGLPRLFGLPWERQANGEGPGALGFLIATGSPLTKAPGTPITVSWAVRNNGEETGYVVAEVLANGARIGQLGPVGVLGGGQVTLQPAATAPSTPGAYGGEIVLRQTNSAGTVINLIAQETFQLNVPAPAPAPAVLQAVGLPMVS